MMNKKYKSKKNKIVMGNGILQDIYNKGKEILVDKLHNYIKDNKLISKGLLAGSVAYPTLAPVLTPLSMVSSTVGYGKMKKMKMKKLKMMK